MPLCSSLNTLFSDVPDAVASVVFLNSLADKTRAMAYNDRFGELCIADDTRNHMSSAILESTN